MTFLLIVLVLLSLAALVDLLHEVRTDGLGHRPPPTCPPYFAPRQLG